MPFQFVTRAEWDAMEVEYEYEELPSPISTIQLVSNTDSVACFTRGECAETVMEIQKWNIEQDRLHDINYNFLLGGDGNVYEGRGWHRKVQKMGQWKSDISNDLVVGLIGGEPQENPPTHGIFQALHEFITHFTEEGKFDQKKFVAIKN